MNIFSRSDLIHYTTPEGEMACPPHIRTKDDAEKWLCEPCKWIADPILKRWRPVPGMKEYDELHGIVRPPKPTAPKRPRCGRYTKMEHRVIQNKSLTK